MDINELKSKAEEVSKRYAEKFNIDRDSDWFFIKIQEEFGELTQKYLMMTKRARDKGLTEEEIKKDFETELADVLCHILLFANHHDVDILKNIDEKWLSKLESK